MSEGVERALDHPASPSRRVASVPQSDTREVVSADTKTERTRTRCRLVASAAALGLRHNVICHRPDASRRATTTERPDGPGDGCVLKRTTRSSAVTATRTCRSRVLLSSHDYFSRRALVDSCNGPSRPLIGGPGPLRQWLTQLSKFHPPIFIVLEPYGCGAEVKYSQAGFAQVAAGTPRAVLPRWTTASSSLPPRRPTRTRLAGCAVAAACRR